MTAPLSVNAQTHTEIEVHDSCNCCLPWFKKKRKDSETITVTEEVFHKTIIQVEIEGLQKVETEKSSHKEH